MNIHQAINQNNTLSAAINSVLDSIRHDCSIIRTLIPHSQTIADLAQLSRRIRTCERKLYEIKPYLRGFIEQSRSLQLRFNLRQSRRALLSRENEVINRNAA